MASVEKPEGFEQLSFEDLDSGPFSWVVGDSGARNEEFPRNYVDVVAQRARSEGVLFVSSHRQTRVLLKEAGVRYLMMYQEVGLKEEYLSRYRRRGTTGGAVAFVEKHWDAWLKVDSEEEGARHVVLGAGQYVEDVMAQLLTWWFGTGEETEEETLSGSLNIGGCSVPS